MTKPASRSPHVQQEKPASAPRVEPAALPPAAPPRPSRRWALVLVLWVVSMVLLCLSELIGFFKALMGWR
jgi:hypothetical protein